MEVCIRSTPHPSSSQHRSHLRSALTCTGGACMLVARPHPQACQGATLWSPLRLRDTHTGSSVQQQEKDPGKRPLQALKANSGPEPGRRCGFWRACPLDFAGCWPCANGLGPIEARPRPSKAQALEETPWRERPGRPWFGLCAATVCWGFTPGLGTKVLQALQYSPKRKRMKHRPWVVGPGPRAKGSPGELRLWGQVTRGFGFKCQADGLSLLF